MARSSENPTQGQVDRACARPFEELLERLRYGVASCARTVSAVAGPVGATDRRRRPSRRGGPSRSMIGYLRRLRAGTIPNLGEQSRSKKRMDAALQNRPLIQISG